MSLSKQDGPLKYLSNKTANCLDHIDDGKSDSKKGAKINIKGIAIARKLFHVHISIGTLEYSSETISPFIVQRERYSYHLQDTMKSFVTLTYLVRNDGNRKSCLLVEETEMI